MESRERRRLVVPGWAEGWLDPTEPDRLQISDHLRVIQELQGGLVYDTPNAHAIYAYTDDNFHCY